MGRIALGISLSALILALSTPAGWAQEKPAQQQQQAPATQKPKDTRVAQPAAPLQPSSSKKAKGQTQASEQGQSRTPEQARKPLSGVEQYTLSTMGRDRSYFYPAFQVAEGGDTNPNNQFGSPTIESVSIIGGAFASRDVWSRYTFSLRYAGSGFIYNRDPSRTVSAHSFSLSQTITGRRSSLLLTDAVSYLPEASFGYNRFSQGGFNGGQGGLYGVDTSGLSGVYLPNQSILTGAASRISNAAVGQYSYDLSPLSSLTLTGAYTLLRFPDSGFVDSNAGNFGFGYNHEIGRKDSLAIKYFGSVYRYVNQPDYNFTNHVVELMYEHRITHLLWLTLGSGPSINIFGNGLNGDTRVSWHATANLLYRLRRAQLMLHYWHYTTAGAGVFFGSQADNVGVRVAERITRMWSGDVGLGYSYNKELQATAESQGFNTWYASANLRRRLGRYMSMFLSYNLQQQFANTPFCFGSSCGTFYTRQYFTLGFNWHPRAIEVSEEQTTMSGLRGQHDRTTGIEF